MLKIGLPIEVCYITVDQTYPVRATVLRPGLPPVESVFPGDADADTVHLGAYCDNELASIASLYHEPPPGETDAGAWRLRGMATLPHVRGQGYGKALVEACLCHVAAQGGTRLWCNARTEAIGFYQKLGFEVIGEEFDIPTVGPHFMMSCQISSNHG